MHLKFKLDPDKITLNQIIDMQDGNYKAMRDVIASALVNGNGEYVEDEEAKRIIGGLKLSQIIETAEEFARQVQDIAINPTKSEPSLPPSNMEKVGQVG